MQYKIENDKLIEAPLNYITPQGKTICNFNLSEQLMLQYGYNITEQQAEQWRNEHKQEQIKTNRTTCTKYQLINVLKNYYPQLYQRLIEEYLHNNQLQFYWNSVNELDRYNQDFIKIVDHLGILQNQLNLIFQKL